MEIHNKGGYKYTNQFIKNAIFTNKHIDRVTAKYNELFPSELTTGHQKEVSIYDKTNNIISYFY